MKKIPFSIAKTPPMTHTAARILTAATILVRVLRNHHNNDNGSQRSGLSATCTRDTLSSTTAGSSQGQASWSPGTYQAPQGTRGQGRLSSPPSTSARCRFQYATCHSWKPMFFSIS